MQVTPNLGLNKPEGNDVANIEILNTNADIIDKEIKQVKEDIQNIEIPTSLPADGGNADTLGGKSVNDFLLASQKGVFKKLVDYGFTDSKFSSTDLGANMYNIFYVIPDYSTCMDNLNAASKYPNLYNSILTKAKADFGLTAFNGNEFIIKLEKGLGTNLPNMVTVRDNGTFKEYAFIYDRDGTNNKMSKMYQTFGEGSGGGGLIQTKMLNEIITLGNTLNNTTYAVVKNYTNTKGGMARLTYSRSSGVNASINKIKLTVDGVVSIIDASPHHLYDNNVANGSTDNGKMLDIPFKSNFKLEAMGNGTSHTFNIIYYINA